MLPPETERLWHRLEREPLLGGGYLIGGTALSLLIGHRASEDLDFAWGGGGRLPLASLAQLVRDLESEGWRMERDDEPRAYQEFMIAGLDLHEHQ